MSRDLNYFATTLQKLKFNNKQNNSAGIEIFLFEGIFLYKNNNTVFAVCCLQNRSIIKYDYSSGSNMYNYIKIERAMFTFIHSCNNWKLECTIVIALGLCLKTRGGQ